MSSIKKYNNKTQKNIERDAERNDESGVALLMTIFVVALSTILVLDFSSETLRYQRQCRMFQERVQADFMLKSSIGFAQTLIELPKEIESDWLGDPWSVISSETSLPVDGFIGEPKIHIVDDSGKININSIVGNAPVNPNDPNSQSIQNFWRDALSQIFAISGFRNEEYPEEEARTVGNIGFDAVKQVGAIHDWIDSDTITFSDPGFNSQGIESGLDKTFFFNRQLQSLSELALVPGITLDKLNRISRFVRTSPNFYSRININTAPHEVLEAIGFDSSQVSEIVEQRQALVGGYDQSTLSLLVQNSGNPRISEVTAVTSQEFSVFVKVIMPNVTRWAKARFIIQGSGSGRRARRNYLEIL